MTANKMIKLEGFTTLNFTIAKERQGVLFKETIQHNASGKKLLVKIYSDSYNFQCYATIDIYDPANVKWNRLDFIPFSNMKTPDKLVYQIPHGGSAMALQPMFKDDRHTLLTNAKQILE